MDTHDIIQSLIVVSVVVVPALGITARFALKPIVDAILRLREGGVLPGPTDATTHQLTSQVLEMRGEIAAIQRQLTEMRDAADFHRALQQPPTPTLPRTTTDEP
jgi:hypothetical protein